ncbi:hypothetical protein AAMO2058_001443100 [Amorphochlora amoebiformis]
MSTRQWPRVSEWQVHSLKTFGKHIYRLCFDYRDQSLLIDKSEARRTEQKHRVIGVALISVEKSGEYDIRISAPTYNFQKSFRFESERKCKEFQQILEAVQISKGRAYRIFREHDKDKNGLLDQDEAQTLLVSTMRRMQLPLERETFQDLQGSISFEQFLNYYIQGIKHSVKSSTQHGVSAASFLSRNSISGISGGSLLAQGPSTAQFERTDTKGDAISSISQQSLRTILSIQKSIPKTKDVQVGYGAEKKLLFTLEENELPSISTKVIIGWIDPSSAIYGQVEGGMGLVAVDGVEIESLESARNALKHPERGFTLTVSPTNEMRRVSLFTMVSTLMQNDQLERSKLEVPRLSGEMTMQKPCAAMRILDDDQTIDHTHTKRSNIQAGVVEITNFRVMFMENSTGLINDIALGKIHKVEERQSFLNMPYTFAGGSQVEVLLVAKIGRSMRLVVSQAVGLPAKISMLAWPEDQHKLFAFVYSKAMSSHRNSTESISSHSTAQTRGSGFDVKSNGWNFYDTVYEYKRLGLSCKGDANGFRLTTANCNADGMYHLTPTYPKFFCVPATLTDKDLMKLVKHRSKGRIPATVYMHPVTKATLSRCAQPMGGVINKRSFEDEKLVAAIKNCNPTNPDVIYLMDARPFKAAVGNKVMGKGFEDVSRYKGAEIEFLGIDNIHKIRQAFNRALEACRTNDAYHYHSKLADSRWVYYVSLIVGSAGKIAKIMAIDGASVIVHCSDGWDRTAQLTSLIEILIDPYFRTRKGFAVVVEKEWLSFGHKFAQRHGHGCAKHQDEQRSPIFLQFLDCVWQLIRQFPLSFEFNEKFLLAVANHAYTCLYGTFLFNCEREREASNLRLKTESVWSRLCSEETKLLYVNPLFSYQNNQRELKGGERSFSDELLLPDGRRCTFWEGLFLRKQSFSISTVTAFRDLQWKYDRLVEMLASAKGTKASPTWRSSIEKKCLHAPKHRHTPSSLTTNSIPIQAPLHIPTDQKQPSQTSTATKPRNPIRRRASSAGAVSVDPKPFKPPKPVGPKPFKINRGDTKVRSRTWEREGSDVQANANIKAPPPPPKRNPIGDGVVRRPPPRRTSPISTRFFRKPPVQRSGSDRSLFSSSSPPPDPSRSSAPHSLSSLGTYSHSPPPPIPRSKPPVVKPASVGSVRSQKRFQERIDRFRGVSAQPPGPNSSTISFGRVKSVWPPSPGSEEGGGSGSPTRARSSAQFDKSGLSASKRAEGGGKKGRGIGAVFSFFKGKGKNKHYSLKTLQDAEECKTLGVDIQKRENYLSDDDFNTVFEGMTRSEVAGMADWKRNQMKRKHQLF